VLFLGWVGSSTVAPDAAGPWSDVLALRPDLLLIDSDATRSAVYHALKDHLPPRTPLLVAPLADDPKFAHLAPGAGAWLRERDGRR
jgi:hypothetical protein